MSPPKPEAYRLEPAQRQQRPDPHRHALLDAGIAMVAGFNYKLSASLAEDTTYGNVVVLSWTHAEQEPQPEQLASKVKHKEASRRTPPGGFFV